MPSEHDVIPANPKLPDAAVIGFCLILAVLLGGGVLGYVNVRRLSENERWVAHTHEVIAELEVLLSTLKDAETGQRGYLLTEDEKYLQPYEDALRRLPGVVAHLDELTSDNAEQQARLEAMEPKIAARVDLLKQIVALMKQGDQPGVMQMIRGGTGKALMDDLRERVATMQQVEQDLLRQRAADSDASSRISILSILLTALLGTGLLGSVFYLSRRNLLIQQRAARAFAEQAERLRTTLSSIGDAVISTDGEGRIINMNGVAESLTGWKSEEATGQPLDSVFRIVNEETRQPASNPALRAIHEGVIVGLANHTVLIAKDGAERPIDDSAAPIRCKDGEIVGCVLVFRDVTQRRRLEKEIAERLRAARQLAAIVESSDDAIIGKSLDGFIQSWNGGAQQIFGYTAAEAIGQHISLITPPERSAEEQEFVSQLRAGHRIVHFQTVRLTRNGQPLDVSLTISPIKDDLGRVVGASKVLRDITEQKRAADTLRELAANLSEADRRKNEFLAMLAHELRNPLAPIRNSLLILRVAESDEEAIRSASEMLERQVGQMVHLVDDLLDVSRISLGKIELHKEIVEIASAVSHAAEVARSQVQCKDHELIVKLPPEPVYLNADPTRLGQVVGNLLNNACKFTNKGGRISLTVEREGDEAVIRVRDTGIGIPADQFHRIFEMFSQVDTSLERSVGGLGIGLALVKQLVEMHGGSVEVHSEGPGKGCEFVVRLPVLTEIPQQSPLQPIAGEPTPAISRRILIVDDNQDAARSLAALLKLDGNELRVAYDGLEGIEAAEAFKPDVILLDIGLPKLNGYEVARRIRAQPWGEGVALVALTGWGQEEHRERSKAVGFNSHMVKPVDLAALRKLLEEVQPAV